MKSFSFLVAVLSISIVNCSNQRDLGSTSDNELSFENKKPISVDTVLSTDGRFLLFLNLSPESYQLEWGAEAYYNISVDTLRCLPDGKLKLEWYSKEAIVLRQGCGTACFFACILPLKPESREIFYMYPLAYDRINNLIAYNGDDSEGLVTVENYLTRQKQVVSRDFLRGPFPGYAIDSIYFLSEKKQLLIKWMDSKEEAQSEIFDLSL